MDEEDIDYDKLVADELDKIDLNDEDSMKINKIVLEEFNPIIINNEDYFKKIEEISKWNEEFLENCYNSLNIDGEEMKLLENKQNITEENDYYVNEIDLRTQKILETNKLSYTEFVKNLANIKESSDDLEENMDEYTKANAKVPDHLQSWLDQEKQINDLRNKKWEYYTAFYEKFDNRCNSARGDLQQKLIEEANENQNVKLRSQHILNENINTMKKLLDKEEKSKDLRLEEIEREIQFERNTLKELSQTAKERGHYRGNWAAVIIQKYYRRYIIRKKIGAEIDKVRAIARKKLFNSNLIAQEKQQQKARGKELRQWKKKSCEKSRAINNVVDIAQQPQRQSQEQPLKSQLNPQEEDYNESTNEMGLSNQTNNNNINMDCQLDDDWLDNSSCKDFVSCEVENTKVKTIDVNDILQMLNEENQEKHALPKDKSVDIKEGLIPEQNKCCKHDDLGLGHEVLVDRNVDIGCKNDELIKEANSLGNNNEKETEEQADELENNNTGRTELCKQIIVEKMEEKKIGEENSEINLGENCKVKREEDKIIEPNSEIKLEEENSEIKLEEENSEIKLEENCKVKREEDKIIEENIEVKAEEKKLIKENSEKIIEENSDILNVEKIKESSKLINKEPVKEINYVKKLEKDIEHRNETTEIGNGIIRSKEQNHIINTEIFNEGKNVQNEEIEESVKEEKEEISERLFLSDNKQEDGRNVVAKDLKLKDIKDVDNLPVEGRNKINIKAKSEEKKNHILDGKIIVNKLGNAEGVIDLEQLDVGNIVSENTSEVIKHMENNKAEDEEGESHDAIEEMCIKDENMMQDTTEYLMGLVNRDSQFFAMFIEWCRLNQRNKADINVVQDVNVATKCKFVEVPKYLIGTFEDQELLGNIQEECSTEDNYKTVIGLAVDKSPISSPNYILKQYPQLKYLAITNSQLKYFSLDSHLSQIIRLSFKNNPIQWLNVSSSVSPSQLTYIECVGGDLNELPHSSLNGCSGLLHLDLSNNSFMNLDSIFCGSDNGLASLHYFNIGNNLLSDLTSLDRYCPNIVHLQAANNHIKQGLSFLQLPRLLYCNLQCNSLEHMDIIRNSPLLLELNLSHNQITSICELASSWLPCLSRLYLDGNKISMLPQIFFPAINIISLTKNFISGEINGDCVFDYCPLLQSLDLSNNNLTIKFKDRNCRTVDTNKFHFECSDILEGPLLGRYSEFASYMLEKIDRMSQFNSEPTNQKETHEQFVNLHSLMTKKINQFTDDISCLISNQPGQSENKLANWFTMNSINFTTLIKLQALWRGYTTRKWFVNILRSCEVSRSFIGASFNLDEELMFLHNLNAEDDELIEDSEDNSSEQIDHKSPTKVWLEETELISQVKQHNEEAQQFNGTRVINSSECSSRQELIIQEPSERSLSSQPHISKKTREIMDEWGFTDPASAQMMMQRAKKFTKKSQSKKTSVASRVSSNRFLTTPKSDNQASDTRKVPSQIHASSTKGKLPMTTLTINGPVQVGDRGGLDGAPALSDTAKVEQWINYHGNSHNLTHQRPDSRLSDTGFYCHLPNIPNHSYLPQFDELKSINNQNMSHINSYNQRHNSTPKLPPIYHK